MVEHEIQAAKEEEEAKKKESQRRRRVLENVVLLGAGLWCLKASKDVLGMAGLPFALALFGTCLI